ncbi:hypothetical protein BS17DRAFT_773183 [Gyrodon lividus]|nr:hypothetical protein BS17DRAFT_773183 [Gyrodon lividus]
MPLTLKNKIWSTFLLSCCAEVLEPTCTIKFPDLKPSNSLSSRLSTGGFPCDQTYAVSQQDGLLLVVWSWMETVLLIVGETRNLWSLA